MENNVEDGESGRRRFIRRLTTLGAAGGIATLLYGRVNEKPLIQLAQAASGDYLYRDYVNTGTGTTELDSSVTSGYAFGVIATATSAGPGSGPTSLYGRTGVAGGSWPDGPLPNAVEGYASATSGITTGVYGHGESPDTIGVWGWAAATTGPGTGIYGKADSPDGVGVYGEGSCGVQGDTTVPGAIGVLGRATATDEDGIGVRGRSFATGGIGVYGFASATGAPEGVAPTGVFGRTDAPGGLGDAGPWPAGVEGYAIGASGTTTGVWGHVDSPDGVGVEGGGGWGGVVGHTAADNGIAVFGHAQSPTVRPIIARAASGQTAPLQLWQASDRTPLAVVDSAGRIGVGTETPGASVHGVATTGKGVKGDSDTGVGVQGYASAATGQTAGVYGWMNSKDGYGVRGYAASQSGGTGVYGASDGWNGFGVVGLAASGSGPTFGVSAESDSPDGIAIVGWAGNAGTIPMVAVGTSGQTSSLQEWRGWRNDSETTLAVVDKDGQLGLGIASPVRQLHIRGNNAVARLDRNVDSASFIFTRTNSDYSQVLKTFTFGVKATGVDAGSFFIGDMHTNVSGSSDNRLLIDTSGNVGIGTTTPSSKLHVNGRVKALGYDTGDITFANSYSVTEDETAGLAFLNDAGEKIAVLDREGNWHIKGKVMEDL